MSIFVLSMDWLINFLSIFFTWINVILLTWSIVFVCTMTFEESIQMSMDIKLVVNKKKLVKFLGKIWAGRVLCRVLMCSTYSYYSIKGRSAHCNVTWHVTCDLSVTTTYSKSRPKFVYSIHNFCRAAMTFKAKFGVLGVKFSL